MDKPNKLFVEDTTEYIKNGTKAFEGFINNGFRAMGVSHRVELVNIAPPVNVQPPEMTIIT